MPLVAVSVIGKLPVWVGVPVIVLPVNVTPVGSVPDSVITGVGEPEAVGVNVPFTPSAKVVDEADVKAAGELPLGPGTADQTKPLGSDESAENVTSVFQLSTGAPLELAQVIPASHTPDADEPEPVYSRPPDPVNGR